MFRCVLFGLEKSSKDEEAADAAAECEEDGQDDHDGEEGRRQAPVQVWLAFHFVVVPDHAARAGALSNDPGNVAPEP